MTDYVKSSERIFKMLPKRPVDYIVVMYHCTLGAHKKGDLDNKLST